MTIERHVYIKLNPDDATDKGRTEVVERTRSLATIPGVRNVEVGVPADPSSLAAWDVCIRLQFDSLDAVEPYREHSVHRSYVDDFLKPRLAVLKAWNFEI